MPALTDLLHPQIVNERISRLKVNNTTLQNHFGCQAGGPSVKKTPSRSGSYDVVSDTREIAEASLPESESKTITAKVIGNVAFDIPRHAHKLPIPLEKVNQLRPIGGPVNEVDSLGEQYILEQEKFVKQRITNLREFQMAAMLRGSYTWTASGSDSFSHTFSGGDHTINYQIPSGNKTQLDMTGGGNIVGTSWANSAAPLVRDVLAVNAAFIELCGSGVTDIFVNSVVWGHVITNTEVQNLAGSVNAPVTTISRNDETEEFTAQIGAIPWVTWHINDHGLTVSGSFSKLIGDTHAAFCVRKSANAVVYYEAPEPVVSSDLSSYENKFGEHYFHVLKADPASIELHSRFNGIPVLYVPAAQAFGTVVF